MATFTWIPDFKAKKASEPKVKPIRFGDGYEQRISFGVNNDLKTWNLSFTARDNTETAAIEAFFEARGAVESFDWTPSDGGSAIRVVCRKWDKTMDHGNINSITATFEQVYEP